ncbi:MAG: DUF2520 domain-containing protein, partial [Bacteroidales bacterium]|nr:DUF2520 domain-containing protein [Bacteroidales bacterium]
MFKANSIVLIGAGNVATHFGKALINAENKILQVYSSTVDSASVLASKLETGFTTNLTEINKNANVYVISILDDALPITLKELNVGNKLIVHTSGFLSMDILKQSSVNYGVFYPLQTFSKSRNVDMKTVPLCIEANSPENLKKLKSLAGQISADVREVNSEQRKKIHLAAVFACNFPNFMYTIADRLLGDSNIDFNILKPLIKETAEKALDMKPAEVQTGPAVRGDENIMLAHLEMLKDYPA